MYLDCRYVYVPRDTDSISVDSLALEGMEQEIELDDDGYPIVKSNEPANAEKADPANDNNGEATEPKKKKEQPEYEDVYF